MPPEQSGLINIDARGKSPAADCLDALVAFPLAVERMRTETDPAEFAIAMRRGMQIAFETMDKTAPDSFSMVALPAQDLLYRHFAELRLMDRFTRAYCVGVIADFFDELGRRGARTFYILDNTLSDERFAALTELLPLSGISVVTPRVHGPDWAVLQSQIISDMQEFGHVAYIEPDAAVNHLERAMDLARRSDWVTTFRNAGPDDPRFQVIALRVAKLR